MKRGKRGVSEVITSVLLIVLAIAAVIVVWAVIKPMISKTGGEVNTGFLSVNLKIEEASIQGETAYVKVKRESGEGNVDKIKLVFSSNVGDEQVYEGAGLTELETKTYSITLTLDNANKVVVYPVLVVNDKDKLGAKADEEKIEAGVMPDCITSNDCHENPDNICTTDTCASGSCSNIYVFKSVDCGVRECGASASGCYAECGPCGIGEFCDTDYTCQTTPPGCNDGDLDSYNAYDATNCPTGNDCDDGNANINPAGNDNNCNNIDENCDNVKDDGYVSTPTSCGVGVCAASGNLVCTNGVVTNTCNPGTPGAEVCGNGIDEDCSGADLSCATTETSCSDNLDNDADTFIDCYDTDCTAVPDPACNEESLGKERSLSAYYSFGSTTYKATPFRFETANMYPIRFCFYDIRKTTTAGVSFGDILVEIRTVSSDIPTSTVLTSATINEASVSTSFAPICVNFVSPPLLSKGVNYGIVASSPTSSDVAAYQWSYIGSSWYWGRGSSSTNSGASWTWLGSNTDFTFNITGRIIP